MSKDNELYKIRDKSGQLYVFSNIDDYQRFVREHTELFGEIINKTIKEPKAIPNDMVNSPSHYANRRFQVWDVMQDTQTMERYVGYLEGSVIKYLMRWDKKENPIQDLRKARNYLNKLIQTLEEEQQHAMARH